jgi:cytidylate kinase
VSEPLIITIDGPAGTGKSTIAAALAGRFGLARLDTGAMYRTVALIALRESIDVSDGDALAAATAAHDLRCDLSADPPLMLLDGEDVEPFIRSTDIGGIVSEVSTAVPVRAALVDMQRATARAHPRLVSEGRDQGSVVFPNAQVRFYLTADLDERVRRRVGQLAQGGAAVDPGEVEAEIRHRDSIDASRVTSPLRCPDGAIRVDSSGMSIKQVVDALETHVRQCIGPDAC